jgi:hypothetical protein
MRIVTLVKTIEDVTGWSEERLKTVKYLRKEETPGGDRFFAVYPKGTEVFGTQANQLLKAGKAEAIE